MKDKYYLDLSFSGDIWKIQKEVEELLGLSDGSGCGFGYRDLSYYFNHKNSLYAAARKVRRMPRRIRCTAYEYINDDYDTKEISLKGIK